MFWLQVGAAEEAGSLAGHLHGLSFCKNRVLKQLLPAAARNLLP